MSFATAPHTSDPYQFATDRSAEEQRLIAQARLFEPATEELLVAAGLRPGMHVELASKRLAPKATIPKYLPVLIGRDARAQLLAYHADIAAR